jgi:hypothetical protein
MHSLVLAIRTTFLVLAAAAVSYYVYRAVIILFSAIWEKLNKKAAKWFFGPAAMVCLFWACNCFNDWNSQAAPPHAGLYAITALVLYFVFALSWLAALADGLPTASGGGDYTMP